MTMSSHIFFPQSWRNSNACTSWLLSLYSLVQLIPKSFIWIHVRCFVRASSHDTVLFPAGTLVIEWTVQSLSFHWPNFLSCIFSLSSTWFPQLGFICMAWFTKETLETPYVCSNLSWSVLLIVKFWLILPMNLSSATEVSLIPLPFPGSPSSEPVSS